MRENKIRSQRNQNALIRLTERQRGDIEKSTPKPRRLVGHFRKFFQAFVHPRYQSEKFDEIIQAERQEVLQFTNGHLQMTWNFVKI